MSDANPQTSRALAEPRDTTTHRSRPDSPCADTPGNVGVSRSRCCSRARCGGAPIASCGGAQRILGGLAHSSGAVAPQPFDGADRELAVLTGPATVILIFAVQTWFSTLFGIAIWIVVIGALADDGKGRFDDAPSLSAPCRLPDKLSPYLVALAEVLIGHSRTSTVPQDQAVLRRSHPTRGRLGAHARKVESWRFCVDTSIDEGRAGGSCMMPR